MNFKKQHLPTFIFSFCLFFTELFLSMQLFPTITELFLPFLLIVDIH